MPVIPFFCVEEPVEGGAWRTLRLLFDLGGARLFSRAVRGRRVRSVDLQAGWRDDGPGYWTHESGAGVRWTALSPNVQGYRRAGSAGWTETPRGVWFARWAALDHPVGVVVDVEARVA